MANIKIGPALGPWEWLGDTYDGNSLTLVSKSATRAVYRDADGDRIILVGTGLTYTGNFATGGTVTGAKFTSKTGGVYLSLSNGSFNAKEVFAEIKNKDIFSLFTVLTSGDDVITGSDKENDLLIGRNAGDDVIRGLGGDDFIKGSGGNNIMNGGKGRDTLSYEETNWDSSAQKGILLDVAKGIVENSWGGTDKISNFEQFRGSKFSDVFIGGSKDDLFVGFQGKDTFKGNGGVDELRYEHDERYGGKFGIVADLAKGTIRDGFGQVDRVSGIERVSGTYFNDAFKGNGDDNYFRGLDGKDSFDGRGGADTLGFWDDDGQYGVIVDLTRIKGNIRNDGFGHVETAKNIENIDGSQLADKIILGSSDGWAWGDDGNDRLVSGTGNNWLGGGAGADIFVFLTVDQSPVANPDAIGDFSHSENDRIDLSKLADFEFIGTATFSGRGPELAYQIVNGQTIVNGDTDGDRTIDFTVVLENVVNLVENDFVL